MLLFASADWRGVLVSAVLESQLASFYPAGNERQSRQACAVAYMSGTDRAY